MISAATKLLGIFGFPVEHSLSPVMHNTVISKLGLDYVYTAFPVKPGELSHAVQALRVLNIKGVNVTVPHKEKVLEYLDEVSEEASKIGAVNTILNSGGRLTGFNTDYYGFLKSITEFTGVAGKKVFMLGAGGAARAIFFALMDNGVGSLAIADLDSGKSESFKTINYCRSRLTVIPINNMEPALRDCDIFINATPVGMKQGAPSPVDVTLLQKDVFVYDLVYNRKTQLSIDTAQHGGSYLNGLDMLVYQGAKSFEIWTGIVPPVELMKAALRTKLTNE